ncbi:MAG: glycosyltransferase family 39 protein, partial [Anaerolineae bacterium]|nr:glycosyltransferase family 39 protein [Anaerolineae bacterium]
MTRQLAEHRWLPVIAVLLLVAAVGAWNLNADGIWYDEWWSLYNAGAAAFTEPLAPAQIWDRVVADDPWQTPGYPLILSAWGNLVGWTELAGRALSLFGGLVAVALTYRFAHTLTRDALAALAAAAMLGASSMFLYFTHELRGYTLYLACSVALFYAYWRVAARPNRGWLSYAAVALSGTLLIYLHPVAFVVLGAIGVWHVARQASRASRSGWIAASVALAIPLILFFPWLNVLIGAAAATRDAVRAPVDVQSLAEIVTRTLYAFSNAAVPLFGLFALFSVRRRGSGFLWAMLLLLTPITLAAYAVTRLSEPRYGIAVQPFLAMIGGLGVATLHRRRVPAAILLILWVAPGVLLSRDPAMGKVIQDFYPQPVREMAQILQPYLTDDAAVLNYL